LTSHVIRDARLDDLAEIVDIYNASIPGRMATADLEPVTVLERRPWFERHGSSRPLWVLEAGDRAIAGWLSFEEFYGRPAYHRTAEVSVYVSPDHRRRGVARELLSAAVERAPDLGLAKLVAFIFGHNEGSLALFAAFGFERWGALPEVAELDGVLRDVVILGLTL
jgi:phosphinothricin acetyltransferase